MLEGAYDYVQPLRQHVLHTIKATGSPPLPRATSARITPSSVLPGPSTSAPEANTTLAAASDADQRRDTPRPTPVTLADAMRTAHSTVNPQQDENTLATSYGTPPAEDVNPSKGATTQEGFGSRTRESSDKSELTTSSRIRARIAQREAALSLQELEQAHRLEEEEERAELEAERTAADARRELERKKAATRREKERLAAVTKARATEYARKCIEQEYFEQELDSDEDDDSSPAPVSPSAVQQTAPVVQPMASPTQPTTSVAQPVAPAVRAPDTVTTDRNAALTGQLPPVTATTTRVEQARTGLDQERLPPISTNGNGFNPNAQPFLPSHDASGPAQPQQHHFVRSSPYAYAAKGFQPAPTPPTSSGMVGENLQWLQALVFRPSDSAKFEGKSETFLPWITFYKTSIGSTVTNPTL